MKSKKVISRSTAAIFLIMLCAGIAQGQTVRLSKGAGDTLTVRTINQNPSGGNTTVDNLYTDTATVRQVAFNQAAAQYETVARLRRQISETERAADQWQAVYRQIDTSSYQDKAARQFAFRIIGNYRYETRVGQVRNTFNLQILQSTTTGLLRARQVAQNREPQRNGVVTVFSPGNISIRGIWFSGTTELTIQFGRESDEQPFLGENGAQNIVLIKI